MRSNTMTQELAVSDVLNYQTVNNASVSSIGIKLNNVTRVFFQVLVPSLGAAGTLDGRLQSCALANFASGVHNIANSNLNQVTTASTPNNNGVTTLEVDSQTVQNANPGDDYVRLQLTGGGNAITVAAVGLGGQSIQLPASQWNLNNTYLGQQVVLY